MIINTIIENQYTYQSKNPDQDGLWKNLIAELFKEFMQFFAPDLYPEIDFGKASDFLQQELYQQVIDQKKGRNNADQIVKVFLKNGEEKYILVHIEVQAIGKVEFSERMFRYFYKIYDKFNKEICAIALLTDAEHKKHYEKFNYSFYGTELKYSYNTYSFHEQDIKELNDSSNPFALAVLTGIYASKSRNNDEQRYHFKQELIKQVLQKYSHTEKDQPYLSALIYFMDYLLQIPEAFNEKLKDELKPLIRKEEPKVMGLERLKETPTFGKLFTEAENEGIEKGIEKGVKNVAKQLIRENFSDEQVSRLTELDLEEIIKLRKSLES